MSESIPSPFTPEQLLAIMTKSLGDAAPKSLRGISPSTAIAQMHASADYLCSQPITGLKVPERLSEVIDREYENIWTKDLSQEERDRIKNLQLCSTDDVPSRSLTIMTPAQREKFCELIDKSSKVSVSGPLITFITKAGELSAPKTIPVQLPRSSARNSEEYDAVGVNEILTRFAATHHHDGRGNVDVNELSTEAQELLVQLKSDTPKRPNVGRGLAIPYMLIDTEYGILEIGGAGATMESPARFVDL